MTLTPEQKSAVSGWVAAGDNLSTVQKKLMEEFKLSMTYMDVRFLVDDLNLALKDAAPKVDTNDVTQAPFPMKPGPAAADADTPAAGDEADDADSSAAGPSGVSVSVDKATLIPGAVASGSVTFSDGVTGKWVVDQYGRPGFTEVSQPGYRPNPEDSQAFMRELSAALEQRGF